MSRRQVTVPAQRHRQRWTWRLLHTTKPETATTSHEIFEICQPPTLAVFFFGQRRYCAFKDGQTVEVFDEILMKTGSNLRSKTPRELSSICFRCPRVIRLSSKRIPRSLVDVCFPPGHASGPLQKLRLEFQVNFLRKATATILVQVQLCQRLYVYTLICIYIYIYIKCVCVYFYVCVCMFSAPEAGNNKVAVVNVEPATQVPL